MILLFVLLFVSAANLAECLSGKDVQFSLNLLQPDLKAIESYFDKIDDNIDAYLHWPNQITFLICKQDVQDVRYLKITGTFQVIIFDSPILPEKVNFVYDNLYFKNGKFYAMGSSAVKVISEDTQLHYTQPTLSIQNTHLSIKYFGLDELRNIIEPFESKYSYHLLEPQHHPPWFLAIASKNFVEFTLPSTEAGTFVLDGALRVLIGKAPEPETLILSENVEAARLLFDPNNHDLTVINEWPKPYKRLQDVFGVRMATVGVLAEVRDSRVKMYNSGDLAAGAPKTAQHWIPVFDFMRKVRHIEPRRMYGSSGPYATNSTYFQVLGQILEKKVNGGETRKDCPLVIQFVTNESYFLCGANHEVDKLCTDDNKLWVQTDTGRIFDLPDGAIITLM